eukprot:jgi/Tetstr1/454201/TSEL_041120.t1
MSTALQVGLLNYHLAQIRTSGNLLAASIAIHRLPNPLSDACRSATRIMSVAGALVAAWMLWHGAEEYSEMLRETKEELPDRRWASMRRWPLLSYTMIALALSVAVVTVAA